MRKGVGYSGQGIGLVIALFVFAIPYILFPTPSLAHFVKSSGSIGTLLHIEPEDDPVADSSSNIILEFKDTEGKFKLSECDCKLQILEDGKDLQTLSLNEVSEKEDLTSITPLTFPNKNIYQLRITGKPKAGNTFSDFEINYDVRIARDSQIQNSAPSWVSRHSIHLIGAGVVVAFFIVALFIQNKRKEVF